MGRNIFRRETLISALFTFLFFMFPLLSAFPDKNSPVPPRQNTFISTEHYSPDYLIPKQNHSPYKAFSFILSDEETELAEKWIKIWSSREGVEKIEHSQNRAAPYCSEVNRIIKNSGLPWELANIPVIESNWKINAVSASGAAGPWQFLESSARGRNLIIDVWRDERRDIWLSTEAAMKEFRFYYRLFGDWFLAVASYNAGPTRIRNILKTNNLSSFNELASSGLIPEETRNYVPQFLAVSYIISNAGKFGLHINWDSKTEWSRIKLNRSIPLELLSRETGISREILYSANPELQHPVTPPPGSNYYLKIPEQYRDTVLNWINDNRSMPERFWRYTVKRGDTLSGIASAINIPLSEFLRYNCHLENKILKVGEKLYLPGEKKPENAENDRLPRWKGRYIVQPGDSYWSIARKYKTEPVLLAETNHRKINGILTAGTILKVPLENEL